MQKVCRDCGKLGHRSCTNMSRDEYITLCINRQKAEPSWRWGQVLFNVLYEVRPDLSERVRGTHFDPFYFDEHSDRVAIFDNFIKENW